MTCTGVIFTVETALVSVLYLSVIITTNWFSVLVRGIGPGISMATNFSGLAGEKSSSCL